MRFNGVYLAAAALSVSVVAAAPASAQTVINFGKPADGTAVSTQYPGVVFSMTGGLPGVTTPTVQSGTLVNSDSSFYPTAAYLNAVFNGTASAISFAFDNRGFNGNLSSGGSSYIAYGANGDVITKGSLSDASGQTFSVGGSAIKRLEFFNGTGDDRANWIFGISTFAFTTDLATAAPEPATWAMMLLGFGAVGFALRRKQTVSTKVTYA